MPLFISVFKSVLSRRDVKIFFTFVLVPLLVPFLSSQAEGMENDYMSSWLSFFDGSIMTQYRFTLPILILSLIISSVFRDEIDSGIMFLFKDINRRKILHAKLLSLFSMYGLYFILTSLVSLISYYTLMVPQYGAGFQLVSTGLASRALLNIFTTICLHLITILLVTMVSIKSKTIVSVMWGVFYSLFAVTAPLLIGIKYFFPNGYVDFIPSIGIWAVLTIIIIITLIYSSVFYYKSVRYFEKVEY